MKKLCTLVEPQNGEQYLKGYVPKATPLPSIGGTVKEATFVDNNSRSFTFGKDTRGLHLRFVDEPGTYIIPDAPIRVNVGEHVLLYGTEAIYKRTDGFHGVAGFQILDDRGNVTFQYKKGSQVHFIEEEDLRPK